MTAREAELLLGGYAAGILTDEERSGLFAAALDNQALFDALADEESLRSLMADPRARAELLRSVTASSPDPAVNATEEQFDFGSIHAMPAAGAPARHRAPEPVPAAGESWWRRIFRPAPMAAFSAVAIAAVGLVVVLRPGKTPETQTAKVSPVKDVAAEAVRNDAPQKPQAIARAAKSSAPGPLSEPAVKAKLEAPVEAEADRNRIAMRDAETPKLARQAEPEGAPPAAAPPPQPLATASSTAPAPQQVREVATEERKVDTARAQAPPAEAPAAAAPAPAPPAARSRPGGLAGGLSGLGARKESSAPAPIAYWIELDRARTAQTQFQAGDSVRIVVDARVAGRLEASIGTRRLAATNVRPGRRYTIPTRGALPNRAGDQDVELVFRPETGAEFRSVVRVSFR